MTQDHIYVFSNLHIYCIVYQSALILQMKITVFKRFGLLNAMEQGLRCNRHGQQNEVSNFLKKQYLSEKGWSCIGVGI